MLNTSCFLCVELEKWACCPANSSKESRNSMWDVSMAGQFSYHAILSLITFYKKWHAFQFLSNSFVQLAILFSSFITIVKKGRHITEQKNLSYVLHTYAKRTQFFSVLEKRMGRIIGSYAFGKCMRRIIGSYALRMPQYFGYVNEPFWVSPTDPVHRTTSGLGGKGGEKEKGRGGKGER